MRTISVILQARIDGFTSKMSQAGSAAKSVGKEMGNAGKDGAKGLETLGGKLGAVTRETINLAKHPAKAKAAFLDMGRSATAEFEKLQDVALQNDQAWSKVSNTLAIVGATAAAVAGLAIREFAQFDQSMAGVASTGEDAAGSIEELRGVALQMGADTAFSAVEAANGIEELARAGVSANDILSGGLTGSLALAAAGQIGVADAAGIAAIAMTQFKLSGDQIPHVADLLAAGAGKAMGGVEELGTALKQSGLVASQFGLSIEETVGGLAAFAGAGLLGSDAGTSFKNMLLKLAKPSTEAQTLMDDLGISAYDAQDKFVGLEGLAGQLSDKLGGLTDKQRDAAFATIFGTDAIRAANTLYENGADGIAQWTAAVDDSGYASETAAKLQDNLVGDLEKLGGAWSTMAIQMGGVADGPLRSVVQGLETLVNIAAETPGASTAIMTTVVAIAALALGGAALMKGISSYAAFQSALSTLAGSSPGIARAASAVTKLGAALGVAGLAVVALQTLGTILQSTTAETAGLEATATALSRVAKGINGIEGLDDLFMDSGDSTRQLADGLFGLGEGVSDLTSGFSYLTEGADKWSNVANGAFWDSLGNSFAKLVSIGTLETSADKVTRAFEEMDDSLSNMSFDEATATFAQLREELDPDGSKLPELMGLFGDYAEKVDAAAAAAGQAKPSQEELADIMSGKVVNGFQLAADGTMVNVEATQAATAAAEEMAVAAQEETDAMQGIIDAASSAADAIQGLNDSQSEAANLFMGSQAAADAYVASLQGIDDAIAANGSSLDQMTEEGRANREELRGLATDARAAGDAMLANGEGVDAANASMVGMRDSFIGVLGQFGIVGDEAAAMADSMGLIPNYVDITVAMAGAKLSQDEADALNASLDGLPEDVKTQIIMLAQLDGYEVASAALDEINGVRAEPVIAANYDPAGENAARAGVGSVEDNVGIQIGAIYNNTAEKQARNGISSVPGNTNIPIRANYNDAGVRLAKNDIASVQDKTVDIVTRYTVIRSTQSAGDGQQGGIPLATGGPVRGPGTGTSDDVPIWGSNGEFMFRTWAASRIGLDRMNYMNRTGKIPQYAGGGEITPTGAPTSGSASLSSFMTLTNTPSAPVDLSGIQAAVSAGLAGARIVMDGRELDARIVTSQSRVARQVSRGTK